MLVASLWWIGSGVRARGTAVHAEWTTVRLMRTVVRTTRTISPSGRAVVRLRRTIGRVGWTGGRVGGTGGQLAWTVAPPLSPQECGSGTDAGFGPVTAAAPPDSLAFFTSSTVFSKSCIHFFN